MSEHGYSRAVQFSLNVRGLRPCTEWAYDGKHQLHKLRWRALEAELNREGSNTNKRRETEKAQDTYVVSFDVEPYHQGTRHHWTICHSEKPDELVSWGHAPTRELAETAASKELEDLAAGRTQGGQVVSSFKPFTHRIANRNY